MRTFIISTRNRHKVEEIQAILGVQYRYLTLSEVPQAPVVVEDAPTFAGNATKKAVELARYISKLVVSKSWGEVGLEDGFVLADDSGLEVDALGGSPGVHSARFAALDGDQVDGAKAGNSADADNNAKLLRLLAKVEDSHRTARFRCVIAISPLLAPSEAAASPVCWADEFELHTRTFSGACEGRIQHSPSGAAGFGYDPLFVPIGFEQSFAELGEQTKNQLSHRSHALAEMKRALNL